MHEEILFSADYQGQIVIWNYVEGVVLNVFYEKAYHLKYPDLPLELIDGAWSQDGRYFAVSTLYGSYSLYGQGDPNFYKTSYHNQFFLNDNAIFLVDNEFRVLTIDSEMEFHRQERGPICNYSKIPYEEQF